MARVDLGLSDEEFYSLTPREFFLLVDQHRERVGHAELLAGVVASTVANRSIRPPKKWATPSEYMPSRWEPAKPARKMSSRKRGLALFAQFKQFAEHYNEAWAKKYGKA